MTDPSSPLVAIVQILATAAVAVLIAKLNSDQNRRADLGDKRADAVAVKVTQVAETLESAAVASTAKLDVLAKDETLTTLGEKLTNDGNKLDDLKKVTHASHLLVNSHMGIQLRLSARLARSLADITRLPSDCRVADDAERAVVDHDARQKLVDEAPGTDAQKSGL